MTYDELKTAVQDYLETSESTFLSNFDLFVRTVENRVNHSVHLPAQRRNMTGTCSTGVKYLDLPDDFLSVFSLAMIDPVTGEYSYCLLKDVNLIHEAYPNPTLHTGIPRYFGLFDHNSMILGPTPDKQYVVELHYHRAPKSLVEEKTGTWLSKNFSSVLLYGVIAEGYRFQKGDAAQQQAYDAQFDRALSLLKQHGEVRVRNEAYANNQAKPTTPVGE